MEGGLITPPALIGTGPLMGVTSRTRVSTIGSLTLAITWPQGFSGQSRQYLAAAHVDGLVGKPMVDTPADSVAIFRNPVT